MARISMKAFAIAAAFALTGASPLLPRPAAAQATSSSAALAEAFNASGVELLRQFSASRGNIVFSPYSIGSAMSMVLSGARGDTEREMLGVLKHRLTREEIAPANSMLLDQPQQLRSQRRSSHLPVRHAIARRALLDESDGCRLLPAVAAARGRAMRGGSDLSRIREA